MSENKATCLQKWIEDTRGQWISWTTLPFNLITGLSVQSSRGERFYGSSAKFRKNCWEVIFAYFNNIDNISNININNINDIINYKKNTFSARRKVFPPRFSLLGNFFCWNVGFGFETAMTCLLRCRGCDRTRASCGVNGVKGEPSYLCTIFLTSMWILFVCESRSWPS